MSWVVAGTAAGTALLGAYQGEQQRKAQVAANNQQAQMAAAQTQYSPWTGMGAGQANLSPVTGSALGGAIQGGLSGAMFAQGMKKGDQKQPLVGDQSSGGPAEEEKMRRLMGYA